MFDFFKPDEGQIIAEIVVLMPVFLLALILSTAAFIFLSDAARIDRISNEIARELYYLGAGGASEEAHKIVAKAIPDKHSARFSAYLNYRFAGQPHMVGRNHVKIVITYRPFTNRYLQSKGLFSPLCFTKEKSYYVTGLREVVSY